MLAQPDQQRGCVCVVDPGDTQGLPNALRADASQLFAGFPGDCFDGEVIYILRQGQVFRSAEAFQFLAGALQIALVFDLQFAAAGNLGCDPRRGAVAKLRQAFKTDAGAFEQQGKLLRLAQFGMGGGISRRAGVPVPAV